MLLPNCYQLNKHRNKNNHNTKNLIIYFLNVPYAVRFHDVQIEIVMKTWLFSIINRPIDI